MDMTISLGNIITVVVMVLGMAVTWGIVRTQVATNTQRIRENADAAAEENRKLHTRIAAIETCQLVLDVRLARIETDVQWIRLALGGKPRGD